MTAVDIKLTPEFKDALVAMSKPTTPLTDEQQAWARAESSKIINARIAAIKHLQTCGDAEREYWANRPVVPTIRRKWLSRFALWLLRHSF